MRGIKSPKEISSIKKACELTDDAFKHILTKIKPGITEHDLSLQIQRFIRKNGARLAFKPIVSFGKNSAEIHHKPNKTKLKKGQIIMLDFGTKVEGYCSDMTRTVFFGKASEKQKNMYKTVFEAQKRAINYILKCHSELARLAAKRVPESSLKAKEVDRITRDYIISKGYPSIPHSLGHGLGKKVHEGFRLSPKSKTKLLAGMVFTIEPGIYIRNFGGVRIEDTFVLENNRIRQLTCSPKTLLEIVV